MTGCERLRRKVASLRSGGAAPLAPLALRLLQSPSGLGASCPLPPPAFGGVPPPASGGRGPSPLACPPPPPGQRAAAEYRRARGPPPRACEATMATRQRARGPRRPAGLRPAGRRGPRSHGGVASSCHTLPPAVRCDAWQDEHDGTKNATGAPNAADGSRQVEKTR